MAELVKATALVVIYISAVIVDCKILGAAAAACYNLCRPAILMV